MKPFFPVGSRNRYWPEKTVSVNRVRISTKTAYVYYVLTRKMKSTNRVRIATETVYVHFELWPSKRNEYCWRLNSYQQGKGEAVSNLCSLWKGANSSLSTLCSILFNLTKNVSPLVWHDGRKRTVGEWVLGQTIFPRVTYLSWQWLLESVTSIVELDTDQ